ncbi:MAG: heme o synthase [Pirellulaceae bacterium]
MSTDLPQDATQNDQSGMATNRFSAISIPPRWVAYFELTKPRISTMVLVSIVVAAVVSSGATAGFGVLFHVALGMFLIAASGNAMNMYLERYSDFLMSRTAKRPLPDRRLSAQDVTYFAAATFGVGVGYMALTLNWQTLACAVTTWVLYVFAYTPLKRMTHLNTEVGAVAGALPIVCGSLAATGGVEPFGMGLFTMLLFWQFPHFMAIAWLYREQYRDGGLKMLTVTEPTGYAAGGKAIVTAVLTGLAGLIPVFAITNTWAVIVFSMINVVLAAYYLMFSIRFFRSRNDQTARRLLRYSILYLPLYMVLLLVFNRL